ncbi:MAG: FHA domain-containing protein [Verrucomicrobiota bacterium]|jgi:pSer/pThr/pTyr-binding forkhead associated (FHA) protein
MAKLVILTQGLNGRAHELNVDRTTIGRVEDNLFQIAEPSVSSHHCEVLLRGSDVVIKDLNSTNGTFINGEQITESVLKPGQTLRLGQIELKLENGKAASAPASAPATTPAPGPAKKQAEATMVIPRGVSLSELEGVGRPPGFDTSKEFSKKRNRGGIYFWIGVGIVVIIIVVLLYMAWISIKSGK